MKAYKLVIFDWDGTVMDSVPKIVSCLQNAAVSLNLTVPDICQAKNVIGLSLSKAVAQLFPQQADLHFAIIDEYKRQYRELDQTPTPLFENVETVLQHLTAKGFILAVATGKGRDGLERLLDESGLRQYFAVTRCSDDAESKPSPQMLQQILSYCQLSSADAVMIGDSQLDMAMAEAINMPRIGVSFGAHTKQQLAVYKPEIIVDCYTELAAHLLEGK